MEPADAVQTAGSRNTKPPTASGGSIILDMVSSRNEIGVLFDTFFCL